MRCLIIFLVSIAGFTAQAELVSGNGNGVGNGGDAVDCRTSPNNPFAGYQSLDFLVQYDPALPPVSVPDLESSLRRIEEGLRRNLPELLSDFQEFKQNIFNETDFQKKRVWEKAPFGLFDLKDEELVTLVPENCKTDGKTSIVQAAIRVPSSLSGRPEDTYVYKYVPEVVDKLKTANPVQLSFLLVHEWLWDFSRNVQRNRRMNYWLHSGRLESWSRDEWVKNLEGIGFTLPGLPEPAFSPGTCEPDVEATRALTKQVLATPAETVLGTGHAFQRTRLCRKDAGCDGSFEDSSRTFRGNFGTEIRLMIVNQELVVRSFKSRQQSASHISCRPQGDGFVCSKFKNFEGFDNGRMSFHVQIGRGCVRFLGDSKDDFGRATQVDEYALVF
jgi:hypothetical protein